jgi:NADP-dependent 3-hydroxy acid dehydrogenase YdfG
MHIKDKVVIITGASKGIGRSTALMFAEKGAKLALVARGEEPLNEVAQECAGDVMTFVGDMSDEKQIKNFVQAVKNKFGRIDILVNNAGLGIFKPIIETSTDDWDTMFNLNIRGLFINTRETLPLLRAAEESVIVNVASLAGKNAIANAAGYVATKHAVVGFSRSLMLEERKNGVRVLTICPGSVDTPFFDNDGKMFSPGNRGKILKPEDVASTILHMIELPQNAMISEIDIRPSNP